MAEIAIPLLLIGSAYLYSNENNADNVNHTHGEGNQGNTENTENTDTENHESNSSNVVESFTGACNSHVPSIAHGNSVVNDHLVQESTSLHNYHDKYLVNPEPKEYSSNTMNNSQFVSMSGEMKSQNDMTHNNMTPFYRGNQTGNSLADSDRLSQSILDNYTGSGSQLIEKTEMGSMFQPQENMQNVYGTQNASDFMQSRVNPSLRMANVKPWQEERVAPGLNLGYTSNGSDIGFNSGLEAQDSWMPKSVDDLRTSNNPKMTYSLDGHMGPASHPIQNRGHQGKVIKKTPDRFYVNDKDRWFTTTGQVKESSQRSEQLLEENNRSNTSVSYFGPRNSDRVQENYVRSEKEESKRQTLPPTPVLNLTGCGGSETHNPASELGYGKNSYFAYANNRDTTNTGIMGNIYSNSLLANIVDPVVKMVRPTRKSNHVGNIRETGNVAVMNAQPQLINPYDKPAVTNREMNSTKLDFNHLNVQRQNEGGHTSNPHELLETNRVSTNYEAYGIAGANQNEGVRLYDSAYRQTFNENKQHIGRTNMGNMNIHNPYMNVRQKENDRENNRGHAVYRPSVSSPSPGLLGVQDRLPQNYANQSDDRLDSNLLQAFKNNPYTKPLGSVA